MDNKTYEDVIRNCLRTKTRITIPPVMLDDIMRAISSELETVWELGVEEGRKSRKSS